MVGLPPLMILTLSAATMAAPTGAMAPALVQIGAALKSSSMRRHLSTLSPHPMISRINRWLHSSRFGMRRSPIYRRSYKLRSSAWPPSSSFAIRMRKVYPVGILLKMTSASCVITLSCRMLPTPILGSLLNSCPTTTGKLPSLKTFPS